MPSGASTYGTPAVEGDAAIAPGGLRQACRWATSNDSAWRRKKRWRPSGKTPDSGRRAGSKGWEIPAVPRYRPSGWMATRGSARHVLARVAGETRHRRHQACTRSRGDRGARGRRSTCRKPRDAAIGPGLIGIGSDVEDSQRASPWTSDFGLQTAATGPKNPQPKPDVSLGQVSLTQVRGAQVEGAGCSKLMKHGRRNAGRGHLSNPPATGFYAAEGRTFSVISGGRFADLRL